MRRSFLPLLFLFFLISCQAPLWTLPSEFDASKVGTTEYDVTYCQPNGLSLKMDVYYPSLVRRGWSAVVFAHGGSWSAGDKSMLTFVDVAKMRQSGILLVSVDYRLAPEYQFPAMIEDMKCAVRYLRAHAGEYNLDPERIGAMGGSAGGHLAALLGVTDSSAGFEVGEYLEYSSRVRAVVSISGLSDLTPPFTAKLFFDRMSIFGTTKQSDPIFRQASPVKHITVDDPPFLIIHGEQDETVPINQSDILFRELQAVGLEAEFIRVKNADHSYESVGDASISPSASEIVNSIMKFWEKNLVK